MFCWAFVRVLSLFLGGFDELLMGFGGFLMSFCSVLMIFDRFGRVLSYFLFRCFGFLLVSSQAVFGRNQGFFASTRKSA